MTASRFSHPVSLLRGRAFAALLACTCALSLADLAAPTDASADAYADVVVSGPPGAAEALGACDGVAVDITGTELIVSFTDNYLVNPDNGPALDGRAIGLGGQECEAAFAAASESNLPYYDWAPISDPMDYDLVHQMQVGDFQIGVPYFYLRLTGPAVCETVEGDPLPTPIDCIETLNPVTLIDDDADGVDDRNDNCPGIANSSQSDVDGDLVGDACDNCLILANGPGSGGGSYCGQTDADADGYGNACDTDFNNDGATGLDDLTSILQYSGMAGPAMDVNCDGAVGLDDIHRTLIDVGVPAGPSGLACAGTSPCPAP